MGLRVMAAEGSVILFFCTRRCVFGRLGSSFRCFRRRRGFAAVGKGCLLPFRFFAGHFHFSHLYLADIGDAEHDAEDIEEQQQMVEAVHIAPGYVEEQKDRCGKQDQVCKASLLSLGRWFVHMLFGGRTGPRLLSCKIHPFLDYGNIIA